MKANCTLLRKIKGRIRHFFIREELSDLLGVGGILYPSSLFLTTSKGYENTEMAKSDIPGDVLFELH